MGSLRHRHTRRDSDFCLCDGLRACSEVISLRPDLLKKIVLRKNFNQTLPPLPMDPVILPEKEFDALAGTVHSQGILTLSRRPDEPDKDSPLRDSFALVLDRIGDPGNLGTILRTARAAGLHDVFLIKGSADPFSDKAIRSASGSQFALGIRHEISLAEAALHLKKLGVETCYRTIPAGGKNLFLAPDLFRKSAIIFGSEPSGAAELEGSTDVSIPMPGSAESLNVAQAATILLFEYVRRIST